LSSPRDPSQLSLVPTGPGEPKVLRLRVAAIGEARWFPDGKKILLTARQRSEGTLRMFVVDVASGELRPLTDDEVAGQELISRPVSPDGRRAIVHRNDGYFVLPVDGGAPAKVEGLSSAQIPLGWLDA